MKTDTTNKILEYIKEKGQVKPKDIIDYIGFGAPAVFRQLKKLQKEEKITKIGTPPKVYYSLLNKKDDLVSVGLPLDTTVIINKNYLTITPQGQILSGVAGFNHWCTKQNLGVEKTAIEYIETLDKYNKFKIGDLVDATEKMKSTFKEVFLDKIYYLDFYSIERFGKTKLGTLLLYAKQTQNMNLINEIYLLIRNQIKQLIISEKIDAVGFIPPTISRKIQLQKELAKKLGLPLPMLNINKVTSGIAVPQKSLSKLEDRIENAQSTIFVDENREFDNILLLDDAVGSGATLNETARKIREKGLCRGKIISLALVGSFKGFDVINEI